MYRDFTRSAIGSVVDAGSVLDSSHAWFDGQKIHRFGSIGAIKESHAIAADIPDHEPPLDSLALSMPRDFPPVEPDSSPNFTKR